jgi:hypothetical protein
MLLILFCFSASCEFGVHRRTATFQFVGAAHRKRFVVGSLDAGGWVAFPAGPLPVAALGGLQDEGEEVVFGGPPPRVGVPCPE